MASSIGVNSIENIGSPSLRRSGTPTFQGRTGLQVTINRCSGPGANIEESIRNDSQPSLHRRQEEEETLWRLKKTPRQSGTGNWSTAFACACTIDSARPLAVRATGSANSLGTRLEPERDETTHAKPTPLQPSTWKHSFVRARMLGHLWDQY